MQDMQSKQNIRIAELSRSFGLVSNKSSAVKTSIQTNSPDKGALQQGPFTPDTDTKDNLRTTEVLAELFVCMY